MAAMGKSSLKGLVTTVGAALPISGRPRWTLAAGHPWSWAAGGLMQAIACVKEGFLRTLAA
jgi:hypothetical protein